MTKIGVLDDWQGVARGSADWGRAGKNAATGRQGLLPSVSARSAARLPAGYGSRL